MEDLKNKTAKGIVWGLLNQGSMQVLNLVFGIVLGRLLTPSDYGIVGVLSVFTLVAQELQTAGFTQGLVNMKHPRHRDYNSVFWFNISVSAFIYIILFACAPLIADFLHEPKLLSVSRFVFLAFFISSFGIVTSAYMTKHLMVKEMAVICFVSLLCSGTTGIVLALLGYSYWSLAWQQVVYITVYNIGRYTVVPFRPSLRVSFEPIRRMWRFAFNMMLTNIVNSMSMKILTFLFGHLLPMKQVGNFSQADKWNTTATDTIRCAVNGVAQPVLAEVRDDRQRTLRVLRKMMRFASFVAFPAMFGLAMVSEEFILLTIGDKWLASAELLSLLAIGGSVLPHHALLKSLVISHGKSRLSLCLSSAQLVLQVVLVIALARFGMYNIVLAFVAYTIACLFVWHAFIHPFTGYTLIQLLADLLPFAVISAVTMLATAWLTARLPVVSDHFVLLFLARILIATLIYVVILKILKAQVLEESLHFLRPHK